MVNVGKSSLFHHRITLHILTLSPKTQVLDHLQPKRSKEPLFVGGARELLDARQAFYREATLQLLKPLFTKC